MRILNDDTDEKLDRLTLYLTRSEAEELKGSLEDLLKHPDHNHSHTPSEDYQKEVTVCIYDIQKLSEFDERSKKIILQDK